MHIPFVSNPQNQKILHSQDDENYVFRCHGKDFRECFEQFEKATIFDGMTIYDAESEIEVLFGYGNGHISCSLNNRLLIQPLAEQLTLDHNSF